MATNDAHGHPAMDYTEHNRTYHGFLKATQIGVASLVVLMLGMYVFLVR